MKSWEAYTRLKDGMVEVEYEDGERLIVKNDGITGYSFALAYLDKMVVNYRNHLRAADLILQRMTGDTYGAIRSIPNVYNSHLAVQSMNCIFGKCDEIPDCDKEGNLNLEFTMCPFRSTCPFNGYNEKYKEKEIVGCNPIYECGLTRQQARVADLIVNTSMDYGFIADALGNSRKTVDNIRGQIFAQLGVSSRPELTIMLQGKRLY